MIDHYFPLATVAACEEHLVAKSLTYAELLKKDGMEGEADVFAPFSPLLRVATITKENVGYKFRNYMTVYSIIYSHVDYIDIDIVPHFVCRDCQKMASYR